MSKDQEFPAPVPGVRLLVSGRVQRVGFRAATRRRAVQLGLRGHARNLRDGRVEVVVAGPSGSVRDLCDWLPRGPALARVDRVEQAGAYPVEAEGFTTG